MKDSISVVATVITLIVTVLFFILSQKDKEISYEIIYSKPVVEIFGTVAKHDISVLFDKKEKKGIYSTLIKIKNTGSVEIEKDDLSSPIAINSNKKIYSMKIVEKEPKIANANLKKQNERTFDLTFSLLNKNNYILIEMITENNHPDISLISHIKGIEKIFDKTNYNKENNQVKIISYYMIFSLILLSISQTFLLRSWHFRNKEYFVMKYSLFPFYINYLTIILIKASFIFLLSVIYSNTVSEQLIYFSIMYATSVFLPELMFYSSKACSWVELTIKVRKSNKKKI